MKITSWKRLALCGIAVVSLDSVSSADPQEPRIDIDARIVQTTADAAQTLGVTWADGTPAGDLAVGSIEASNIDLALSALERAGRGRVLSKPRVITLNNLEAEIQQGVQVPAQTVVRNTVTVTWKELALNLRVLPQVSSANVIGMRVALGDSSLRDAGPASARGNVTEGDAMVVSGTFLGRQLLVFITPRIVA